MRMVIPDGALLSGARVVVGEGGLRLAEGAIVELVIQSKLRT